MGSMPHPHRCAKANASAEQPFAGSIVAVVVSMRMYSGGCESISVFNPTPFGGAAQFWREVP